ncbi:hypothetical protein D3C84_1011820 [compost metagenome]
MTVGRAVALQPFEVGHTLLAESLQSVIADHAAGFVLEVIEHRLRAVADASGALLTGTTAGVHHAATLGTGTAASEAIGNQHIDTIGPGFEGGTGTRRPPADDQHVTLFIPLQCMAVADPQRREDGAAA